MDLSEVISWIGTNEVIVVGEYTTPEGPYGDDYFLVIIGSDGEIVEAPIDESFNDQVLQQLETISGVKMELKLAHVTSFRSRILFPESMQGKPLYEFVEQYRGIVKLYRMLKSFGSIDYQKILTDEVTARIFHQCAQ